MVRHIIACAALAISSAAFGADAAKIREKLAFIETEITLPELEVLKTRINKLQLPPNFDERTNLSRKLTKATKVGDVVALVCVALGHYNEKHSEKVTYDKKSSLVKALLHDREDILENLLKLEIID